MLRIFALMMTQMHTVRFLNLTIIKIFYSTHIYNQFHLADNFSFEPLVINECEIDFLFAVFFMDTRLSKLKGWLSCY